MTSTGYFVALTCRSVRNNPLPADPKVLWGKDRSREKALRRVFEILRADFVKRPQDDRDPLAGSYKHYEPAGERI